MKVTICIGSSCHIKGSRQVVEKLQALVAEYRLCDLQAFRSCGSLALKHRLNSCASGASSSAARGIFLDQRLYWGPLPWQTDA